MNKDGIAWYFRTWAIVAAVLMIGPLGLLLLWFRPETRLSLKVWVTIIVVGLFALLGMVFVKAVQQITVYYEELARSM
ncbi:MAG: hypothetical protein HQ594_07575 [Candidatus Omnitrophica bacterium]|nr:hypothetical protein [Candidatus Omnitrophota bacterium]